MSIRTIPRFLLTALAVTTMVSATACQKSPSAKSGSTTSSGPVKVVYIPKNLGNPYFDAIVAGFKETSQTLGYQFEEAGPASPDPTAQIPFIDAAIQKKVSAIAISPNDDEALLPSLEKAKAAGVKVITINSDMKATDGRDAAIMPTDFSPMGKFLLDLAAQQMNYTGKFAILSATSTAPDQNAWIEGLKKELKNDPQYAKMQLVDTVYGDDQVDKSTTQARALLTKHPDLAAIISPTAVGLPAAAKVISESPQKGTLVLTGLGLPSSMKAYIQDGTVKKFGLWDPKREGVIAGYLLAGMARGTITAQPGATFSAGSLGTMSITPAGQVISGPLVTFDGSNISQFNF
ncbi:Autoinducer 2-binding protein lsrB [Actinoplanes sp. SE50]|uniref:substrate-binding domain-containing protein n=1 Tax=unclassified Actinoplanes TaxID=2626549 RepID=UPI00023EBBBC|nr:MULTISPECIES: substrate-binding domain-containing protein [unclassified Actinoplanes]AEV85065.1 Autoinducer 2-binding protein lsrB [Actinoplanes sp. SE50/110]ATO83456.1 Autoinducer 2-binding protein lsrB [Actinoplanes sp. SE50]SLM00863.1 uncharacterized protein ACSP50_4096 [Actinoplanes sp. SE50/110]